MSTEKPKHTFKVGDRVRLQRPNQEPIIGVIEKAPSDIRGRSLRVRFENCPEEDSVALERSPTWERLELVESPAPMPAPAPASKFKIGDRVRLNCPGHTPGLGVIKAFVGAGACDVRFDGGFEVCCDEDDLELVDPHFVKHDGAKLPLDLLPHGALIEIAKVLEFGAKKYAPNNWRNVDRRGRYYSAALRHLFAWFRGEDKDSETGLPHLAHAGCCLLFLLECELDGLGKDDRVHAQPSAHAQNAQGKESA